tara:strand:+ start:192 stop:1049 length:858 start_codon:yes stop_codon:yes gene_type:complete
MSNLKILFNDRNIYVKSRFIPLLLDLFPNSAAAFSLQKLKNTSTNVVRVRRSLDNLEQDFTATQITDGTIIIFCGVGNGFVTVFYNQSNNNNAFQTSASKQPLIVSAGNLILTNGKPSLFFDGIDDELVLQTQITYTDQSIFTVLNLSNNITQTATLKVLYSGLVSGNATSFSFGQVSGAIANERVTIYSNPSVRNYTQNTQDILARQYIYSWLFELNSLQMGLYQNTQLKGQNSNISQSVYPAGVDSLFTKFNDKVQELIIYPSYQNINRVSIEANINSRYNIY